MNEHIIYSIALSLLKNVGGKTYKKLLDTFGTAKEVYLASRKQLKECSKLSEKTLQQIVHKQHWKEAIKIWQQHRDRGVYIVPYEAKNYPTQLKNIYNPPPLLYTTREINLNDKKLVSIVGTRNATTYGKNFVKKFIEDLAIHTPIIVSGLAYGIDICVHKEALSANLPTVAVVAGGLDMVYPVEHRSKIPEINQTGCLISESPLGVQPEKYLFPSRNRIIAGMTQAVVIVEAAKKSGALITATYANDFGREVFALPGDIHNTYSAGTNYLIKTHQAHMLTSAKDFFYLMHWPHQISNTVQLSKKKEYIKTLAPKPRAILQVLSQSTAPISLDELSLQTNIPSREVSSITLQLAMDKLLTILPGNKYQFCP